ncbi:acyltransferase family protein [Domibacillus indicus]|uniref:acyltransferase family protein n=1 Tax=Domibacillus indicus TaxID=1437523 RepID=UPI00203F2A9F|nr:acyltransferase family protein [Domibacillus indicus]MCM3787741.1 acyltransferase family protein [Domibacillus indicus]
MKKRDNYFDNVRFFLIFLVVFGHLLRPYIHTGPFLYALYMVIYSFHMPAFILISGFFAKSIKRPGYIKKAAEKLLIPFLIFQCVYSVFYFWIDHEEALSVRLLIPEWSLWFLMSLFLWHVLLLGTVKWLKNPFIALILSVAAGVGIGLVNESLTVLSIGRTFVFFPFFLAGYYAKKEWFQPLFRMRSRIPLFLFAAGLFAYCYTHTTMQIEWLFGSQSYAALGADGTDGLLLRLFVYAVNIVMIAFFLSLVPHKVFFFTAWGRNTLYVYLLHGFFVQSSRRVETLELPPSLLVLFGTATVLTFVLASPWTAALFRPFLELKRPSFFIKKENKS